MANATFLRAKAVADQLEITCGMLAYFAPCVLHFYIPRPKNRLWPSLYIDRLVAFLQKEELGTTNEAARRFSRQASTKELMADIMADFSARRRTKVKYSTNEAADLFCVSSNTISSWRKAGLLPPTPDSTPQAIFFSREDILRIGQWKLPR